MTPAERDALEALAARWNAMSEGHDRLSKTHHANAQWAYALEWSVRAQTRIEDAEELRALLARSEPPTPVEKRPSFLTLFKTCAPKMWLCYECKTLQSMMVCYMCGRLHDEVATPESAREVHSDSHGLNTPPAKGVSEELTKQAGPADAAGRVTPRSGVTPGFAVGGTVPGAGSPSESARESEPTAARVSLVSHLEVHRALPWSDAMSAVAAQAYRREIDRAIALIHADLPAATPPAITEAVRAEVFAAVDAIIEWYAHTGCDDGDSECDCDHHTRWNRLGRALALLERRW